MLYTHPTTCAGYKPKLLGREPLIYTLYWDVKHQCSQLTFKRE